MLRKNMLVITLLVIVSVLIPFIFQTDYYMFLLNTTIINVLLVLSLNIAFGFAGILTFAQVGFWAIGAYCSAILAAKLGLSFWAALPLSIVFTTVVGYLLGKACLKLKGPYLAMVTIGFSEIVRQVAMNFEKLTGGAQGLSGIPSPVFLGFAFNTPLRYYFIDLAVLLVILLLVWRLYHSRLGRAMCAVRDDYIAAEAAGISVASIKVLAFSFSAGMAGLAGGMYSHMIGYISPDMFHFEVSIVLLAMLIVGGTGTVPGSVVGAVFLTILPEVLRFMKDYYMIFFGAIVLIILLFFPAGIVGYLNRLGKARKGGAQNVRTGNAQE